MIEKIVWPKNKKFAFTVFDDTDLSVLDNTKPVYDFLYSLGIKTTKSCWVFDPKDEKDYGLNPGSSLEDEKYRNWLVQLKDQGFEIGLHNVSSSSSKRESTIEGIEEFIRIFGNSEICFANHAGTKDSIYWASNRISGISKVFYKIITRNKKDKRFVGHISGSEYYWADYLKKYVKYIRNFTFDEINTLKICPMMPYINPDSPMANYWFASCDGGNLESFCNAIQPNKVDKLVREGGLCIMYTHFAYGFYKDGKIDTTFEKNMKYIAAHDGWFAPVSEILDYVKQQRGYDYIISRAEHNNLSRKWILEKLLKGGTT